MLKFLISACLTIWICLMVMFTPIFPVQPSLAFPIIGATGSQSNPFLDNLEAEILPELETILNPEQKTAFDAALETGSLREAIEAATLTIEQEEQLDTAVKSALKAKVNALSPAEKQEFFINQKAAFLKSKDQFMPDLTAINEKKKAFMPDFKAISEKKKAFMPDLTAINEKKKAFMPEVETTTQPE